MQWRLSPWIEDLSIRRSKQENVAWDRSTSTCGKIYPIFDIESQFRTELCIGTKFCLHFCAIYLKGENQTCSTKPRLSWYSWIHYAVTYYYQCIPSKIGRPTIYLLYIRIKPCFIRQARGVVTNMWKRVCDQSIQQVVSVPNVAVDSNAVDVGGTPAGREPDVCQLSSLTLCLSLFLTPSRSLSLSLCLSLSLSSLIDDNSLKSESINPPPSLSRLVKERKTPTCAIPGPTRGTLRTPTTYLLLVVHRLRWPQWRAQTFSCKS